MQKVLAKLYLTMMLSLTQMAFAQQGNEAEIRNLERLEVEALMKRDTAALYTKYWSPKMIINTPANRVGTVEDTKRLLMAGMISYTSFDRIIEKITFNENLAISMGHEVIKPQDETANAGKTVTRRYTNIWMKGEDGWRIVARQASVIKVEQ